MSLISTTPVGILPHLFHTILNRFSRDLYRIFEFNDDPLDRPVLKWPPNIEISPCPAQTIFPVNLPSSVYYPLKECLEKDLWAGLLILEPLNPALPILSEELLKLSDEV